MRGLARCDEASQANLGCTLPTGTEAAASRGRDADEDGLNLNACAPRFTLPSPSKSTSKSTTRTTQQRPTSAKHSESLNNFRPMVSRARTRVFASAALSKCAYGHGHAYDPDLDQNMR